MGTLDPLIEQITDPVLRAKIAKEVTELESRRTFGLIYEKHLPEAIRLPGAEVRRGATVMLRDRHEEAVWTVTGLADGQATLRDDDGNTTSVPVADLVVARVFGQPIYPGLRATGSITRGGEKPHHLVINGENHHALQTLRYTHAAMVDVIYIDPPYNTGGDFTYNDKYIGADDRYRHSKWLSFMEKRLSLAHDLLKPTGVIIVAIDDNEYAHLKLLMDDVFEPQNFLASLVWQGSGKNDARYTAGGVDYMLMYAKSEARLTEADVRWKEPKPGIEDALGAAETAWSESEHDPAEATRRFRAALRPMRSTLEPAVFRYDQIDDRGRVFQATDVTSPNRRENLMYEVIHPGTGRAVRTPAKGWRYARETMDALIADDRILFGPDETTMPRLKRFLTDQMDRVPYPTFSQPRMPGSKKLEVILGEQRFKFPKDHDVLARWIGTVTQNNLDAVVLDFFAGSGSSTHAVMALNAIDGGRRQSIAVTNNEVDQSTADALKRQGHKPGDPVWEARGIYQYVTRPRVETVVTGVRHDGSAYSEGLNENVTFADLTYLDRSHVERGHAFEDVAHLLWLLAGARGAVIEEETETFAAPADAHYAVLFDEDCWSDFVATVKDRDDLTHAFVVTDSDAAFSHVESVLPDYVQAVRLYESYLSAFEINVGGH
ncbi:site-specific DNA-methyltransferase [Xylanimonas protaetiae]|uniref:site-specific DNA-methyltransferase n=1 Tax=Xylanimonas protaetiae TaxID=2509457 RepID=UPI0013EB1CD6|nr:DNA methyltransferase [Xylanimonas protaetiae]